MLKFAGRKESKRLGSLSNPASWTINSLKRIESANDQIKQYETFGEQYESQRIQ